MAPEGLHTGEAMASKAYRIMLIHACGERALVTHSHAHVEGDDGDSDILGGLPVDV